MFGEILKWLFRGHPSYEGLSKVGFGKIIRVRTDPEKRYLSGPLWGMYLIPCRKETLEKRKKEREISEWRGMKSLLVGVNCFMTRPLGLLPDDWQTYDQAQ